MGHDTKTPGDLARRIAGKENSWPRNARKSDGWRRESFILPRAEARQKARDWFDGYPRAAYMTEIEYWRELPDDVIEFTMRRLPSAD